MSLSYNNINEDEINSIIKDNIPFIVKTISNITGKYVSIGRDSEFSIGLLAFTEALKKYDKDKGEFNSFAKIVISSRIKNYLVKEKVNKKNISLEELRENGVDFIEELNNSVEENDVLREEIENFKKDLNEFNFTLEELVQESPKHHDTRKNAISISEKISRDEEITTFIFDKKRLPIKNISTKYFVTEKILKRSKKFIISVVIIIFKNYRNIRLWIRI